MITPVIPPEVVERKVCRKLSPILNERAGAIKNLILLTANTISIFRNPDTVQMVIKY